MPLTHYDLAHCQLLWENDDRTQALTVGPPDPEEAGWETAHDHAWACWLDVSGTVFGLTTEHTRNLSVLTQCGDDHVERTAAIPAAGPHHDLTLHVDTGLGHVILRIARDGTDIGCRTDIPASDCPPIAELLAELAQ